MKQTGFSGKENEKRCMTDWTDVMDPGEGGAEMLSCWFWQ